MEEWKEYKLGEIYEVHNGLSKGRQFFGSGYPFLSFSVIFNNWFIPSELTSLVQSTETEQESYSIKQGDIFITRTSETADELGMSCVALKDYPTATYNGFTKRIRQYNYSIEIEPKYIGYYLRNPKFRQNFQAFSGSMSTRASLTNEALLGLSVKVPPLATQQKIAAILSSLDDKIELNNKINANLEAQAQAIFKSWFVDFEPFGGKMPEGWEMGKLGDFVEIKRGGSPRPIQKYLSDEGYRWLKISDVTSLTAPFVLNIAEHIKEEGLSKTVFLKAGSLVLSNSATPGIPKIIDLDTCIHDGWLYFPKSQLSNEYLYLLFKEIRPQLVSLGNGSIFTNLKTNILKNFEISMPDKETISKFQSIIKPMFEKILETERETKQLETIRDTLLPKLMNGEIEVDKVIL